MAFAVGAASHSLNSTGSAVKGLSAMIVSAFGSTSSPLHELFLLLLKFFCGCTVAAVTVQWGLFHFQVFINF